MAQALWQIREQRLYRADYPTFEDYCLERWGFSEEQGRRLCRWAEVAQNLSDATPPIGGLSRPLLRESHARPLAKLTPAQQKLAWQRMATVPLTAKAIEAVCEEVSRTPTNGHSAPVTVLPRETDDTCGRVTPPISWYGSKRFLAQRIIELIPAHQTYVEPFFGSGWVFFSKPPSAVEIINDRDDVLIAFFRVLRDRNKATELQRRLRLTPHARVEHDACKARPDEGDDIEIARRFFVRCRQSYAGRVDDTWHHSFHADVARDFHRPVEALLEVSERLRHAQIDNRDFREVLAQCDRRDTVIYCDPPYLEPDGRRGAYKHPMTRGDHEELLRMVVAFRRGIVILSGRPSDLYNHYLKHWRRYEVRVNNNAHTSRHGPRKKWPRTEVIWCNR
ncbi:MAG: DNA adenine methylase [Planctomycetes bacterium]|nr:DNA adenine methylase [Planctomycetota bacterium]